MTKPEPLTALFQDEFLLVLDKPEGLLSVPGRGADKQDCLSRRAQQVWPDALVLHRLDMATSGLILMARNLAVQRALGDAFAQRTVHKRYQAVVQGTLAPAAGLTLRWPAIAGRHYTVECTTQLPGGAWFAVPGFVDCLGIDDVMSAVLPVAAGTSFFRVRVTP